LVGGLAEIRKLRPEPSRFSLLRAVRYLRTLGKTEASEELAQHVKRQFPAGVSKTRAKPGDVRYYSVAAQRCGIDYVRIPVSSLGAKRGDRVRAAIGEDEIRLSYLPTEPLRHVKPAKKSSRAKEAA
jgi:hypothetical protein